MLCRIQLVTIFAFHEHITWIGWYEWCLALHNILKLISMTLYEYRLHHFKTLSITCSFNLASNIVLHLADIITLEVPLKLLLLMFDSFCICNAQFVINSCEPHNKAPV